MTMTADEAYAEAERRIEEARQPNHTNNRRVLDFSDLEALGRLPELNGLVDVQAIYLHGTSVNDVSTLSTIDNLNRLFLSDTPISDISPLRFRTPLQRLDLNNTAVRDLRPILELQFEFPRHMVTSGLSYRGTPASIEFAELAKISQIDDAKERTEKTIAYLRRLPPYPDPLPQEVVEPNEPDPDALPRIIFSDSRIDIKHVALAQTDLNDPIKQRMYERLSRAVTDLIRLGNRYPEIFGPANALSEIFKHPFAEADLLDIHIEIAALTDLVSGNSDRPKAEQLDVDCLNALGNVTRLGPPLTLGTPDVDLFEQRNLEYAQGRRDLAVIENERAVAMALSQSPLLTERAAHIAALVAAAPDEGRIAGYRVSVVKNMILQGVAFLAATPAIALYQQESIVALEFISANREAILAVASSWSEQGHIWAADLIARSGEALRKFRE